MSAAGPSGEAGKLPGAFCPRGLFPGGRNCEGSHKTELEREKPLPAVGCPLRLRELLLRGQRLRWQGCRQGGQQRCCSRVLWIWQRRQQPPQPANSSLPAEHQALESLGPSCRSSISGVFTLPSPGERQRRAQRGAEPCLSKTSQQTERAGSVLSQGSAMKWGTVIPARRRWMASAEPGSCSGDQQLPWCSCGKRWLAPAGPGLRCLQASGGRRGHAAGPSAAGRAGARSARPGIRHRLLRVVLEARENVLMKY